MTGLKRLLFSLSAILFSVTAFTQGAGGNPVEMADQMRSNGRIYVVVAVMVTILAGLILYVVRLDRKISKWEKLENKN
ncbi:MAG: CcmD family protein [Bacteroidota bacterium]